MPLDNHSHHDDQTHDIIEIDPHQITPDMLEVLGLGQIAYVRPGHLPSGKAAIAIHAANGDVLGFADNLPTAHATVTQNEMHSFSVH